jgi:hypothetical protein
VRRIGVNVLMEVCFGYGGNRAITSQQTIASRKRHLKYARACKEKKRISFDVDKVLGAAEDTLDSCLASSKLRSKRFKRNGREATSCPKSNGREATSCQKKRVKLFMLKAKMVERGMKKGPKQRKGTGWSLSPQTEMDICKDYVNGRNTKASLSRSYSCTRPVILRSLALVADMSIEADIRRILEIIAWLKESEPLLEYSSLTIGHDSTSAITQTSVASRQAPTSGAIVPYVDAVDLVSAHTMRGFKVAHVEQVLAIVIYKEATKPALIWSVEVPSLELFNGKAEGQWRGLRGHPVTKALFDVSTALSIRTAASRNPSFLVLPADDATTNDSLVGALGAELATPSRGVTKILCQNHQTQLSLMETIISVFGLGTTNDLYVVSAFFGLSDYYLRMQCAVVPFLAANRFVVVRGYIPTVAEEAFAASLLSFMEDNLRQMGVDDKGTHLPRNVATTERMPLQLQSLRKLFSIWVGGYKHGEKMILNARISAGDLGDLVLKSFFCHMAPTPEVSKWTKLAPAVNYHVYAGTAGFIQDLVLFALGSLRPRARDFGMQSFEESLLREVSYQQVSGKKYMRTVQVLRGADKSCILAFVAETTMYLHQYYMQASHHHLGSDRPYDGCALLDMISYRHSRAVTVLQYISTVLRFPREWSRLPILLARYGVDSFDELARQHADVVILLSKALQSIASGIRRRLFDNVREKHSTLAMCDTRVPDRERHLCALTWASKNICCVPEGYPKTFAAMARAAEPADHVLRARFLFGFTDQMYLLAHALLVSIACLERLHAVFRRMQQASLSTMPILSGVCYLARRYENYHRYQSQREAGQEQQTATELVNADADRFQPTRGRTPLDIFIERYVRCHIDTRILGCALNAISHRELLIDAFHASSQTEKEVCADLSRQSFEISANRRQLSVLARKENFSVAILDDDACVAPIIAVGTSATQVREHLTQPSSDAVTALLAHQQGDGDHQGDGVAMQVPGSLVQRNSTLLRPLEAPRLTPLLAVSNQVYANMPEKETRLTVATHPWRSNMLSDYKQGKGIFAGAGHNKNDALASLRRRSSVHTQYASCADFPAGKINHPFVCSGLCNYTTNCDILDVQRRIASRLSRLVAAYAPKHKHCLVSGIDLLICIAPANKEPQFYRVEDAKGQYSRHPSVQRFALLRAQHVNAVTFPFTNVNLTSERGVYYAPVRALSSPWSSATLGDTLTVSNVEVAARMAIEAGGVTAYVLGTQRVLVDRLDEWVVKSVLETIQMPSIAENMAVELPPVGDSEHADVDVDDGFGDAPLFGSVLNPTERESVDDDGLADDLADLLDAETDLAKAEYEKWNAEQEEIEAESSWQVYDDMAFTASKDEELGDRGALDGEIQGVVAHVVAGIGQLEANIDAACVLFGLVIIPSTKLYTFADGDTPLVDRCVMHRMARGSVQSIKATCRNRSHGRCQCWLTTNVAGSPVLYESVVTELMRWAADGRHQSENQHFTSSQQLKRRFGMAVK